MSANCISACAIPFAFVVLMLLVWQKMQQERAQYEALHPSEKVVALTVIQAARLREEQVGFGLSDSNTPDLPRGKPRHARVDSASTSCVDY
ncbi:hypothetical protein IWX90DRAFT_484806 [Phyllosticta citrichinensis]|uniref:Uncharacterized protein n=1 Tax=Phyllosticta citrichinensis TaxID=1130410 RepID=A0ABR1Y006_9PEZI